MFPLTHPVLPPLIITPLSPDRDHREFVWCHALEDDDDDDDIDNDDDDDDDDVDDDDDDGDDFL